MDVLPNALQLLQPFYNKPFGYSAAVLNEGLAVDSMNFFEEEKRVTVS